MLSHSQSEQCNSWAHNSVAQFKSKVRCNQSAGLLQKNLAFCAAPLESLRPSNRDLLCEPLVASLVQFRVHPSTFGTAERAAFEPTLVKLNRIGFDMRGILCHALQRPLSGESLHRVTVGHSSGTVTARVQRSITSNGSGSKLKRALTVTFFTPLSDGSYTITSSGEVDFTYPSNWNISSHPSTGILDLWEQHRAAVLKADIEGITITPSPASVPHCPEKFHDAVMRSAVGEGTVFKSPLPQDFLPVPPAPTGIRARRGRQPIAVAPEDARSLLQQIQTLAGRHVGWVSLLATGTLFAAATTSWGIADAGNIHLILGLFLAALCIHELGHYLAMKITGFNDPRTLIFPFVPESPEPAREQLAAWRKTVVALAGPIPGLVLGLVAIAFAHFGYGDTYATVGAVFVILNGITLLPVTPLDGGWAVHYAFGYRRPLTDIIAGFALTTALIWAAFTTGNLAVTAAAAVYTLICLPRIYRRFRTNDSLGESPVNPAGKIGAEDVAAVLSKTCSPFVARLHPKQLASGIAWVCGRAQSKPLSDPSLVGFCLTHTIALLLALGALVFSVDAAASGKFSIAQDTQAKPDQTQIIERKAIPAAITPDTESYTQPKVVSSEG